MCSKKQPFFVTHVPRFFAAPTLEYILWPICVFTLRDVFQKTAIFCYTCRAHFCHTLAGVRSMWVLPFRPLRCVPKNRHFLLHMSRAFLLHLLVVRSTCV